ncbi:MAG TPA: type II toxin-antitoxin system VapC family toxin [Terriglobia bacterium]|nr:type II toxin-antitoxin system VapC family toxin [Terriglobia bacterium]
MPGKVLLDTNVIIAFFAGEKPVPQHLAKSEVFVSTTVLGELYYGAYKSAHAAANLSRIEQFAAAIRLLSCDAVTAQHYGRIKDGLRSRGRPIPENDIWIAAVAQQYSLPLASRDEHFKEVDGLVLENW